MRAMRFDVEIKSDPVAVRNRAGAIIAATVSSTPYGILLPLLTAFVLLRITVPPDFATS
jgi:hypothetical protein